MEIDELDNVIIHSMMRQRKVPPSLPIVFGHHSGRIA